MNIDTARALIRSECPGYNDRDSCINKVYCRPFISNHDESIKELQCYWCEDLVFQLCARRIGCKCRFYICEECVFETIK